MYRIIKSIPRTTGNGISTPISFKFFHPTSTGRFLRAFMDIKTICSNFNLECQGDIPEFCKLFPEILVTDQNSKDRAYVYMWEGLIHRQSAGGFTRIVS